MRTLRVLNIGQNYRITGGSDRYFFNLQNLLEAHGHIVIPFAAKHRDNLPSPWQLFFPDAIDFKNPNIRDISSFFYSIQASKKLEELIRIAKPDIAHLHIYYGKLTASILSVLRRHQIPIVQTLHDYKAICPTYSTIRHGKYCDLCRVGNYWHATRYKCNRGDLKRSIASTTEAYISYILGAVHSIDKFFAVSEFQRKLLIARGLPESRVMTLYNFVRTDLENKKVSDQAKHFLYFGRIEKEKGVFSLVDAAARIPELPLIIAGDGKETEKLQMHIRDLGATHIKMVGFKSGEKLQKLINESLCVIVPSECFETFGLVLIEALALGKPVIASRIGAIPEIVQHGINGFLFEPGDVDSLENLMRCALRQIDRMVDMGLQGQALVQKHFSEEVHYQALIDVYSSLQKIKF